MIIQVLAYDPDYFVANALVFSEFQVDRAAPLVRMQSTAWLAFREQQTRYTVPQIKVIASGLRTRFPLRTLTQALSASPGAYTKYLSSVGTMTTPTSQYPAQDNPIVEVTVTAFDIANPVDTYLPAAPTVG